METNKDSYKILEDHPDSGSVDDDNESDINEYTQDQKGDSKRIRCKFIVATLALLLILTNLGWCWGYYYLIHNKSAKGPAELTYCMLPYICSVEKVRKNANQVQSLENLNLKHLSSHLIMIG